MVFSRQELELLTIPELSLLVKRYGLRPTGTGGQKTSYLTTLMAFPALALQQLEERRGFKQCSKTCSNLLKILYNQGISENQAKKIKA